MKSVYHVLDDEKNRIRTHQGGQCSSTCSANNKGTVWRQLWRLPCPPKIKHFMWRLARNSLPLKMNIQRRGMKLDTRCPVCYRLDEDGGHCFLKCKFVRRCWLDLQLEPIRQSLLSKASAWDVLKEVLLLEQEVCLL